MRRGSSQALKPKQSPTRRKKDFSSFLAKTANEKPWTLCARALPLSFSPSIKGFTFLCCAGTCTWLFIVADPQFQLSSDPE